MTLRFGVRPVVSAVLLAGVPAVWPTNASADTPPECYEQVDLNVVRVACEFDGPGLQSAQNATPASKWAVYQLCKDGTSGGVEACSNPRACTVGSTVGTLYAVFRDGEMIGIACLTAGEAGEVEFPIRRLVIQAFKELDWTASELVVQPPGGRTLVNLETNFYTTNMDLRTITVTLQGESVAVTARPIAYRWNFGDGSSITTSSPGAPYPSLDVSHAYDRTDEYVVSVDTQYGDASFTVNGGPPEPIPSTIWIDGATQDLAVVEALPQLVVR